MLTEDEMDLLSEDALLIVLDCMRAVKAADKLTLSDRLMLVEYLSVAFHRIAVDMREEFEL